MRKKTQNSLSCSVMSLPLLFLIQCQMSLFVGVDSVSLYGSPAISYNNFVMHPTPFDNRTIEGSHGTREIFTNSGPGSIPANRIPVHLTSPLSFPGQGFRQFRFRPQDARHLRLYANKISPTRQGQGQGQGRGQGQNRVPGPVSVTSSSRVPVAEIPVSLPAASSSTPTGSGIETGPGSLSGPEYEIGINQYVGHPFHSSNSLQPSAPASGPPPVSYAYHPITGYPSVSTTGLGIGTTGASGSGIGVGIGAASAPAPAPFYSRGPKDEMLDKFLDMMNLVDDMADKRAKGPVGHVIDKHAEMAEFVSTTTTASKGKDKPHSCYRRCSNDPGSFMTCSYNFTVANYYILSPHCMQCPNVTADCSRHGCLAVDGQQRAVAVVNKMLPGPSIQVCEGDTIVVDVLNKLIGQETTIHWHGIHQDDTPWMDGVPHLTQCPISMGSTFRYQFQVPKAGTYFWHSHHGAQRADGVVGKLIVRRAPEIDVHAALFDFDLAEHEILVMDWLTELAIAAHITGHVTDMRELPRQILVNGRGIPPGFYDDFRPQETLQTKRKPFVPIHEVRVQPNYSYRFRLISNGITLCPIELSIESHSMLVIASDGFDIQPVSVQSLVIHAGERYDFVVRADQPIGSYWMKFRGLIDCNTTQTYQVAVLNYEGTVPGALPRHTIKRWEDAGQGGAGVQLNPVNVAPGVPGESITVAELSSVIDPDPEIIAQERADHQFYLSFDFNPVPNVNFGKPTSSKSYRQLLRERIQIIHFLPQLNFISHAMPVSPPLTQPETIPSLDRCNLETKMASGVNCTEKHCKCTHWLNTKLNSIVEIVLVDMGVNFDAAHPFHLHGHSFRVVGIEKLGNTTDATIIKEWDRQGLLPRRRQNAPIKDTVYVPDGGYTILRFRADNPGIWFFHCHIEFHAERGMALIFQVGQQSEIPRAPPNFPTCGDFLPPVDGPSSSSAASSLLYRQVYSPASRYLRSAKP